MTCRACLGTGYTPLYEPCAACGGMGLERGPLWRRLGLIYLLAVAGLLLVSAVLR